MADDPMSIAFLEARAAEARGEVPVGAALGALRRRDRAARATALVRITIRPRMPKCSRSARSARR